MKNFFLFILGGGIYVLIEQLWRGHSHWTMFLVGGICFFYAGNQNEVDKTQPFWKQVIKTTIFITCIEFVTGCIVNEILGWHVWDYSGVPFNLFGQICLPYSLLWIPLSAIAIKLDDYIREVFKW